MQENTIFKISVIVLILGLGFLFFYVEELELKPIKNLDSAELEEVVNLQGIVKKLTVNEKVSFIDLEAEEIKTMSIILFNEEDLYLKEGDQIELSGTVEEYQGEKEVIANKIILKS